MSYKLTIADKPAYLHAIVTGENTKENTARYIDELIRECLHRGYSRVLIEERLVGPPIRAAEVIEIAEQESGLARGCFTAIAFVDLNLESRSLEFIENVAVNRGLPMKVFSSVPEAEEWLRAEARGDTGPSA
jgi:hypothetical protein